jgi:hypothetical protein
VLEGRPWAEHQTLVCEVLGAPIQALKPLFLSGLLYSSADAGRPDADSAELRPSATVTLYGALRNTVAARLRDETQLREQLTSLTDELSVSPEAISENMLADPGILDPAELMPAPVSSGLELLERVRNALEDSATWLQEQGGDQAAHQLAAELAALQAALPNLTGPRLPFARPVAGATAT